MTIKWNYNRHLYQLDKRNGAKIIDTSYFEGNELILNKRRKHFDMTLGQSIYNSAFTIA